MYQFAKTETIPNAHRKEPSIENISRNMMGPYHKFLVTRTAVIYAIIAIIGILPSILTRTGVYGFSPAVQCAGWGLMFPGAGLIASGKTAGLVLGILFFIASATLGNAVMAMAGMFFMGAYLWVIGVIGAAFLGDSNPPLYTWIIICALVILYLVKTLLGAKKIHRGHLAEREQNDRIFPELLKEYKSNQVQPTPPEERELSEDAVKASRFFFDHTLNREVGDFSGYDTADQILLSALRYSLDYLGYGMATMQCFYTPNFHGYLKEAQEFVIDSLTVPKICGYWKLEELWGNFRWNPDPIKHHNIMFSGWSGILPVLFTSNTGDDKYEKEDSMKFRPFDHSDKWYGYNNEKLIQSIAGQWDSLKSNLIPCEPAMIFPWCNGWGINTVLAYDRIHGTNYVEKAYPKLEKRLNEDWTNPNGKLCVVKNARIGTIAANMDNDFNLSSSFAVSRIFNAFDPSLAEKEYILGKNDTFEIMDGEVQSKVGDWEAMGDIGNFKKGPGNALGTGAVAAQEMGERNFAEKLLKKADELMERVDDPHCYYFKNASVTANASLALARFAQKDDLYNMIHHGPRAEALRGPILNKCSYPDVLVAKARSHTGTDLELVLYDGNGAGDFELGIERLQPNAAYEISELNKTFQADENGNSTLTVYLDGRTPLHIIPA